MSSYGNQTSHDLLVANFKAGEFDAQGNRVKARTGFRHGHFFDARGRVRNVAFGGPISASTGTVTVASNDFTDAASIHLGVYVLTSDVEWTPGASTTDTAAAIATAIDNLPGFSATSSGSDVNIVGPKGPAGYGVEFTDSYEGAVTNFTLSPDVGHLEPGGPTISGSSSIP